MLALKSSAQDVLYILIVVFVVNWRYLDKSDLSRPKKKKEAFLGLNRIKAISATFPAGEKGGEETGKSVRRLLVWKESTDLTYSQVTETP